MTTLFKKVMKHLNIQVSSAYHPRCISKVSSDVNVMLCTYCISQLKDWDEGIPLLLFAVNNVIGWVYLADI